HAKLGRGRSPSKAAAAAIAISGCTFWITTGVMKSEWPISASVKRIVATAEAPAPMTTAAPTNLQPARNTARSAGRRSGRVSTTRITCSPKTIVVADVAPLVVWEEPSYRRFVERLGSFARVILFDKRGMGLSDRVQAGTLEERMDDVRAVMDAVGSERAALIGESEGGPMSMLFAASFPQRTVALLLCGAEVKEETTEDWPWGERTREEFEESMVGLPERWSSVPSSLKVFVRSWGDDPRALEWFARLKMQSASPAAAEVFMRMAHDIDVRDVAPAIRVPTLILHSVEDQVCHVENARYLARTIPGARYVELPGGDHVMYADLADLALAEIREFLTGVREGPEPERVLATVLFTDLVGSTERAAELGDRRWRELLERHHEAVRRELARFSGREIDTAGDGFLAAFDGPARAIRC